MRSIQVATDAEVGAQIAAKMANSPPTLKGCENPERRDMSSARVMPINVTSQNMGRRIS
jgi:hypothetical protein